MIKDVDKNIVRYQVLDSNNKSLNSTYQNNWNLYNNVKLYDVSTLLKKILIFSEDKNFYLHSGVDWFARLNAFFLNLRSFQKKRGASTISEQVVRIVYPRRRTFLSRIKEGFEANLLERKIEKNEILEFYINQVPFASNRRGFEQASEFYFDRNLNNLNLKEMLFLIVNLRAPSSFNPYRNQNLNNIERKIELLSRKLFDSNIIDKLQLNGVLEDELRFSRRDHRVDVRHFLSFLRSNSNTGKIVKTSIDSDLQNYINNFTYNSLKYFNSHDYNVRNGAVLVLNRHTMEILSYNSISLDSKENGDIDCVQIKRKSGSTLKPFLYGVALQNGLSLSSKIEDSPMNQSVLHGSHNFLNASHKFYGEVTLRDSLANSLNIPALKVLKFVGVFDFCSVLKNLGFKSFEYSCDHYDIGLAVGAGEITLFELVRAFAVLANNGMFKEVNLNFDSGKSGVFEKRIFDLETVSLLSSVLSDRMSRRIEFSRDSILNFPQRIAVKTGTSTDYKDAWATGYNDDYVVGVWFGNVDYQSMNLMSGALGPGMVLRNVFGELGKLNELKSVKINRNLIKRKVDNYEEYFSNNSFGKNVSSLDLSSNINIERDLIKIINPFDRSYIAIDPRTPVESQKIRFEFSDFKNIEQISWEIDGEKLKNEIWRLKQGKHFLTLRVRDRDGNVYTKESMFFCY